MTNLVLIGGEASEKIVHSQCVNTIPAKMIITMWSIWNL